MSALELPVIAIAVIAAIVAVAFLLTRRSRGRRSRSSGAAGVADPGAPTPGMRGAIDRSIGMSVVRRASHSRAAASDEDPHAQTLSQAEVAYRIGTPGADVPAGFEDGAKDIAAIAAARASMTSFTR